MLAQPSGGGVSSLQSTPTLSGISIVTDDVIPSRNRHVLKPRIKDHLLERYRPSDPDDSHGRCAIRSISLRGDAESL